MSAEVFSYERILKEAAINSQPFSEGGAAAAGAIAFASEARPIEAGY